MTTLRSTAALVLLASCLAAQRVALRIDGVTAGNQLGRSVAGIGDMDHDDRDEVIVGAWQGGMIGAGYARVVIASTGAVLRHFDGDSTGDEFGRAVGAAGDFDGDGYVDVVIGAPGDDDGALDAGTASVFSGRTGYVLAKFVCPEAGAAFGWRVDGAGDLDGDGYDDVLIGAPLHDVGTIADAGRAFAYSGRTHALLRSWSGTRPGEQLGHGLAIVGDLDGDLLDDVALGSPMWELVGDHDHGRVQAFAGRTGTVLLELRGVEEDEYLGWSVGRGGDLDGVLASRIVVGRPQYPSGDRRGRALVSPGDWPPLYGRDLSGAFFGCAVSGAGDVDGDGHDDLIIGAYGDRSVATNAGAAHVISGRTRAALAVVDGTNAGDWLGFAVDGAGDIDGDGRDELVVGVPFADGRGVDAGAALIYDFDLPGSAARALRRGSACAHLNRRLPHIGWIGHPKVGHGFELRLRGTLAGAPVVLNLGRPVDVDLAVYGMPGCRLLAEMGLVSVLLAANGFGTATSTPIAIPDVSALVGYAFAAQWVCAEPGVNPMGVVLSDSVILVIGA
ncbi:MAG: FG-GAP repeat protein [Planctomycetes bacterium]|nr:FG-GAP repeat protein [Planctomycetota bacterium]